MPPSRKTARVPAPAAVGDATPMPGKNPDDAPRRAQAAACAEAAMQAAGPADALPLEAAVGRLALLEAQVARLSKRVEVMDAMLRLRDPILLRHGATDPTLLSATARVDAQDHLEPDSGFHPLEYALDGAAIRWTGPGTQSRVTMFLDRTRPINVTLDVHDFGGLAPETVRIAVDGESLPLRATAAGGWAAGPWASHARLEPTEIAILVPATTIRRDADGAARATGVAIRHLELGPA